MAIEWPFAMDKDVELAPRSDVVCHIMLCVWMLRFPQISASMLKFPQLYASAWHSRSEAFQEGDALD